MESLSMPELSPAALAVWEAFNEDEAGVFVDYGNCLAAALRAAVNQVVPDQQEPASSPHMGNFITNVQWRQSQTIRTQLLAIATELEAQ
jgi:hypothetical protein